VIALTELFPGVHRIEAEVGGRPLYLFLFVGERRLLLDAGCASTVDEFIVPALAELGLGLEDLDLLLVTHSDLDHQGGTRGLRQANPSLWVGCGVRDAPLVSDPAALVADRYKAYLDEHGLEPDGDAVAWMREESGEAERIDVGLAGGELIGLTPGWNLQVLHVPGHSPGHLAVFDERTRALFSGDCLQGSVYLGLDGMPKLCPTYTHIDDYLATASRIESLAPSELHGCHWPPQRGPEVFAFIGETRDYVRHLDELVRASLDEPLTLDELIARVNARLEPPWPDELAAELVYSLHGHAEWLVALGLATRRRSADGRVVYGLAR
jgi:glyoxylase-like metal-dependent hydrolase (beta-lactamase superfamily II)